MLVDGPSADHDLVLRARLSTQAPDIDASVYLTDCDPSAYRAGDFVEVEIVGARDYDLLARPVVDHGSSGSSYAIISCLEPGCRTESGHVPTFLVLGPSRWECLADADVAEQVRNVGRRAWRDTYGLEIFDVQFRREAGGMVLRVQIDRPGPGRDGGRERQRRGLRARQPRS